MTLKPYYSPPRWEDIPEIRLAKQAQRASLILGCCVGFIVGCAAGVVFMMLLWPHP